jgi:hypothetical protein
LIHPVAPERPDSGELPIMLGGSWASTKGTLAAALLRTPAAAAVTDSPIVNQRELAGIWF